MWSFLIGSITKMQVPQDTYDVMCAHVTSLVQMCHAVTR